MLGHDPLPAAMTASRIARELASRAFCISEILGDRRFRHWVGPPGIISSGSTSSFALRRSSFWAQSPAVGPRRGLSGSHTRAVFPVMA
jgi:hypothetical protein